MESVSSPDSLTLALTEVNGKAGKQRIYSRLGRKAIELKTISADGSLIHTRETILCPSTPFKTDGRTLDPVCSHPTDPNRVSDCLLCWHLRQSALTKLKAAGEPSFPRLPTRIGYVKDGPGGNFFSTTPGQRYYQEIPNCTKSNKRCPNTNSLGKHLKTHKEIILGKATGGGANQLEKDRAANFYRSLTNNGDHDKTIMQSGHGTTCPTSTRSSSYESECCDAQIEYEEALSAKLKRCYEDNKEAFNTQHSEKKICNGYCIKT
ncbi:hypothetical protein AFLA_013934 [Aspergillus flavus NRRL3357]|nr:hypothetical protein AFLA_013934 [Aspergillus flavus NRRL3357]